MARKPVVEKDDAAEPRRRGNGVQKVYDKLRRSILELSLPPGSPLDEMKAVGGIQPLPHPIREAMVRLAAEGC